MYVRHNYIKSLEGEVILNPKNRFEKSVQSFQILADTIGNLDGHVSSTEANAAFIGINHELAQLKAKKPELDKKIVLDDQINRDERKILAKPIQRHTIEAIDSNLDEIEFIEQIRYYRDNNMYGSDDLKPHTHTRNTGKCKSSQRYSRPARTAYEKI